MENKHIQYPSMPFDIDDTVYYMEKVSEKGGHPGYKIIKCICYGYYNFGNGWKIKLRTNRNKFKFAEYDVYVRDVGYTVFYNKADLKERLMDINGFIVEK